MILGVVSHGVIVPYFLLSLFVVILFNPSLSRSKFMEYVQNIHLSTRANFIVFLTSVMRSPRGVWRKILQQQQNCFFFPTCSNKTRWILIGQRPLCNLSFLASMVTTIIGLCWWKTSCDRRSIGTLLKEVLLRSFPLACSNDRRIKVVLLARAMTDA